MRKQPDPQLVEFLKEFVERTGGSSFTLITPRVCDRCGDDSREAFPSLWGFEGDWEDLCNDCFEKLMLIEESEGG